MKLLKLIFMSNVLIICSLEGDNLGRIIRGQFGGERVYIAALFAPPAVQYNETRSRSMGHD